MKRIDCDYFTYELEYRFEIRELMMDGISFGPAFQEYENIKVYWSGTEKLFTEGKLQLASEGLPNWNTRITHGMYMIGKVLLSEDVPLIEEEMAKLKEERKKKIKEMLQELQ